ncbi:DNA glycosylase [Durotheca rogersii]|uniref:DNA glycosylase n=1 Tax=Durotheca rogersii TaxID=419775 RepID=UPI0022211189|nr:DNA glycosylase [Durotheca rogersii]KAI5862727.1 DNA glycosylase [Durotheca rogersii]
MGGLGNTLDDIRPCSPSGSKVITPLQNSKPAPAQLGKVADSGVGAAQQRDALGKAEEKQREQDDSCAPIQPQSWAPKCKAKSPYFATLPTPTSPPKEKASRPPRGTVPCTPFPRLDAPTFGLVQEELAADPFRLLVAVTFLIRTKGTQAIPVFRELMLRYPSPHDLENADADDIVSMIKHLGLARVRAAAIQRYARTWRVDPPRAGVRYEVKNYPRLDEGVNARPGETSEADGARPSSSAWEVGHMTQGRYIIDSWRIFCRDVLLGLAEDWKGKGREGEFQPEWMRVLPEDKELRACLRWLWMREGWVWDPRTGERDVLPETLRRAVDDGRVSYDDSGELRIVEKTGN